MEKECSLRHENGNCFHVGGFCTAVPEYLCKALRSAYERGKADAEAYIFHCGDTDEPQTNADRIRSMTDEELAEILPARLDCSECPARIGDYRSCVETCKERWLAWLKQEAE